MRSEKERGRWINYVVRVSRKGTTFMHRQQKPLLTGRRTGHFSTEQSHL